MTELMEYLKEMETRINNNFNEIRLEIIGIKSDIKEVKSDIKQTEINLKEIIESNTIKNSENYFTIYKKLDNLELEASKLNISLLENQLAVAKLKLIK
jgi:hypothetical protein